jgi:hypothetical protein
MNRASHAIGVVNQRGPCFCGEIHLCGQLRALSGGRSSVRRGPSPQGSQGPQRITVAGFGRGATATEDAVQQRATFHVKHDAQRAGPSSCDTPARATLAACVEYVSSSQRISPRLSAQSSASRPRAVLSVSGVSSPCPSGPPSPAWRRSAHRQGSPRPLPVPRWPAAPRCPRRHAAQRCPPLRACSEQLLRS